MVQWLGLPALTAEGLGSMPGQRTKIPQAAWHGQEKKKKKKETGGWKVEWGNRASWGGEKQE